MRTPAPADLQRWSEEVARDRTSLAFLPLARAFRRQGRRDAALRLCLKGLESHPHHVAAHGLLALLYLEAGDRGRAADEWAFVLRLDEHNFEALRGLGFCLFEQRELVRARRHLEHAARVRPDDPTVREALRLLESRERTAAPAGPARSAPAGSGVASAAGTPADRAGERPEHTASVAPRPGPGRGAVPSEATPGALFDGLLGSGPLLGALLVDGQGLILAGRLKEGSGAELLGAMLNGALAEAARTVTHLDLGDWSGMLIDTSDARVHVTPVTGGGSVVVAARREAPTGWILRVAGQAASIANAFMGSDS
jgi:predicted regulator of Ras-like GTPase activity (Roadblock/LC7/MglB family)